MAKLGDLMLLAEDAKVVDGRLSLLNAAMTTRAWVQDVPVLVPFFLVTRVVWAIEDHDQDHRVRLTVEAPDGVEVADKEMVVFSPQYTVTAERSDPLGTFVISPVPYVATAPGLYTYILSVGGTPLGTTTLYLRVIGS